MVLGPRGGVAPRSGDKVCKAGGTRFVALGRRGGVPARDGDRALPSTWFERCAFAADHDSAVAKYGASPSRNGEPKDGGLRRVECSACVYAI
jgi:hypothetical protein